MPDDKFYRLLGVDKEASDDEIKKAYKKAALKHHPDRNPQNPEAASKKFKEISEAFDVLSDSNKRAVYDQYGEEALKSGAPPPGAGGNPFGGGGGFPGGGGGGGGFGGMGGGGGGMEDIFSMFMNQQGGGGGMGGMGGDPFGGMGGGGRGRSARGGGRPHMQEEPKPKPEDITRPLPVSLEDLYNGATKKMKISRRLLNGELEEKVVEMKIKPGYKPGTKVRFNELGTEVQNGPSADVVFVIEEKPHPTYTRHDNDLSLTLTLPLLDALAPSPSPLTRSVALLDGTSTSVTVPAAPVQPGTETKLVGKGMPISKKGMEGKKGNLVVKWQVELPKGLSKDKLDQLRKVLA